MLCSFTYSHYNFNYTKIRKLHNVDTMNSINLNVLLFKEVRSLKRNQISWQQKRYSLLSSWFCDVVDGRNPLGFSHERVLSLPSIFRKILFRRNFFAQNTKKEAVLLTAQNVSHRGIWWERRHLILAGYQITHVYKINKSVQKTTVLFNRNHKLSGRCCNVTVLYFCLLIFMFFCSLTTKE